MADDEVTGIRGLAAAAKKALRWAGRGHYFADWRQRFAGDDVENAFAIFERWVTTFHRAGRAYGAVSGRVSDTDHRIAHCDRVEPVRGRAVLELGPMEAGHTKQLLDLGATSVLGVEAHPEHYLKCLVAKEALGLPQARFVFGDFNGVVARELADGERFDVCSAIGVLYHMQRPLETIDLMTRAAPVSFVWTHYASQRAPKGAWTTLTDHAGRRYEARVNHYGRGAHLGGIEATSTWLAEESLLRAFRDRGHELEVLERTPNVNGDALLFIARRT